MNQNDTKSMTVNVGGQSLRIRVTPEEEAQYQRAADVANRVYEEIVRNGVGLGPRAMAMATFQLAVELDEARRDLEGTATTRQLLGGLIQRIDERVTAQLGEPSGQPERRG